MTMHSQQRSASAAAISSAGVSRRGVLTASAVGAAALATGLTFAAPASAQGQMPLNGRMRMLEYLPAHSPFRLENIPFQDANGGTVSLSTFAGRPTILTMWRINCHVCQADMPELDELTSTPGGQGLNYVPVAFAEDQFAAIRGFYDRKNINSLPIYRMNSIDMFNTYAPPHPGVGSRATPATILVDRNGMARLAIVGVRTGLHLPEGQELLQWLKRV